MGAAAAGLLAAACGLPFGIGLGSTSDLLKGSAGSLSGAGGFEIAGRFTSGPDSYRIDVEHQSDSATRTDLTSVGVHIEALRFGSTVYYHGKEAAARFSGADDFGRAQPNAVGDRWFTTSRGDLVDTSAFTDVSKLKANFLSTSSWSRKDHLTVNGVDAAELTNGGEILDITESSPYRLVRVRTRSGTSIEGLTDGDLSFSNYGKDFKLREPQGALNLDDRATFPPFYEMQSVDLGGCRGDPCTVAATVKNAAGVTGASEPSSVSFNVTNDSDGTVLGTCRASIQPDVANGRTVTLSCQITGGAWTAFVRQGGNYTVTAQPDNPAYD